MMWAEKSNQVSLHCLCLETKQLLLLLSFLLGLLLKIRKSVILKDGYLRGPLASLFLLSRQ